MTFKALLNFTSDQGFFAKFKKYIRDIFDGSECRILLKSIEKPYRKWNLPDLYKVLYLCLKPLTVWYLYENSHSEW